MKVIDSSSLAKYVNREVNWEDVGNLIKGGCTTLELALKEVGNSIWKRVMKGELTRDTALSLYKDLVTLRPFKIANQEELYPRAFEVSTTFNIPLYDSLFIELSRRLSVQLVTSDEKQVDISRKLGIECIYVE